MYEAKVNNIVCVLHSLSIPDARLASVEVSLTILKMENRQTHRGDYKILPGLKIVKWPSIKGDIQCSNNIYIKASAL